MLKFRIMNKAGGGRDYTNNRLTYKRCYRLFPNRNLTLIGTEHLTVTLGGSETISRRKS